MTRTGDFHELPMLLLCFGMVALAFLVVAVACTLWSEHRSIAKPAKRPIVVRLLGVAAVLGLFLAVGLLLAFGAEWLTIAVFGQPTRLVPLLGAALGIALSSLAIQAATNAGRLVLGLATQPLRWSAFQPRAGEPGSAGSVPGKPALEGAPSATPWFAAMEYYALILNRTYKVFVDKGVLCGAKVGGAVSNPRRPTPQMLDQAYWVATRSALLYDHVDVTSAAFLKMNASNFQLRGDEIARIEYRPGRKWGMGNVPHSGRLLVHLKSGCRRELILLGEQDGDALQARLQLVVTGSVTAASTMSGLPQRAPV